MAQFVQQTVANQRAVVTLCRPDLHNAFNEVLIEELTTAFVALAKDPAVRVVVLAGEGKSFCAGADVHWMRRMVNYSLDENRADADAMAEMLHVIRACTKPVIARIQGAAIGGGVGLAAACDLAVAVKTAVFGLTEVKLGIVPAVVSPYVMEKIGPGHMRRYALTAERFDAIEAKRIGLVSEVFDTPAQMDAWIEDIEAKLIANGPQAVAACKQLLREGQDADWNAKRDLTVRHIAERRVSPEGQEGLNAFLEKRRPDWSPRM